MLLYAATAAGAVLLLALLVRCRGRRDAKQRIKTLVVLGSGGHTAEMLRLITAFDFDRYGPLTLVTAATDTTSRAKAERELPREALATARWVQIPRAREVGQSFVSSVPSTLRALFACFHLIWTASPDLVLVNGPGTCVPVAVLGRLSGSRVIFAESWCRVSTLSLTGRIMYWVAHRFVVHWPELARRYPRAEYLGRIC